MFVRAPDGTPRRLNVARVSPKRLRFAVENDGTPHATASFFVINDEVEVPILFKVLPTSNTLTSDPPCGTVDPQARKRVSIHLNRLVFPGRVAAQHDSVLIAWRYMYEDELDLEPEDCWATDNESVEKVMLPCKFDASLDEPWMEAAEVRHASPASSSGHHVPTPASSVDSEPHLSHLVTPQRSVAHEVAPCHYSWQQLDRNLRESYFGANSAMFDSYFVRDPNRALPLCRTCSHPIGAHPSENVWTFGFQLQSTNFRMVLGVVLSILTSIIVALMWFGSQ